jgi:hypothetical protein
VYLLVVGCFIGDSTRRSCVSRTWLLTSSYVSIRRQWIWITNLGTYDVTNLVTYVVSNQVHDPNPLTYVSIRQWIWGSDVKPAVGSRSRASTCHDSSLRSTSSKYLNLGTNVPCHLWTFLWLSVGWDSHLPIQPDRHVIYFPFFTTICRLRFTLADSTRFWHLYTHGLFRIHGFYGESLGYGHMIRHSNHTVISSDLPNEIPRVTLCPSTKKSILLYFATSMSVVK